MNKNAYDPHERNDVAGLRYHLRGPSIMCSFEGGEQTQKVRLKGWHDSK